MEKCKTNKTIKSQKYLTIFFSNAVINLNIEVKRDCLNDNVNALDPIKTYENHPSVLKIREKFSFKHTSFKKVYEVIISLNSSTASSKDTIPANIIKSNVNIFAEKLYVDFNRSANTGIFPNNLKPADITPALKNGAHTDKENYRPVSILSGLSKIFERLLFSQINSYIDSKLSKHQCGFRKGLSSQHCLLVMLEK